jgi:hypothetical protein
MIRSSALIVTVVFMIAGIVSSPKPVRAQGRATGGFKLSQEVHWGEAVLPTGDYTYSVGAEGWPTVVSVRQKGGLFTGLFIPQTSSRARLSDLSKIVLARIGEETYVTSLQVQELGIVLNFSAPNLENGVRGPDASPAEHLAVPEDTTQGFFTIINPHHVKVSAVEAERVYLAACETIEREFNRSTPIRPRLTLHLGSTENNLHYPIANSGSRGGTRVGSRKLWWNSRCTT